MVVRARPVFSAPASPIYISDLVLESNRSALHVMQCCTVCNRRTAMAIALSFNPTVTTAATEARMFLPHGGSLFLATGQWDAPTTETGPKMLRQDHANGPWLVDFAFPMKMMVCNCVAELNFPSKKFSTLATGFWAGPSEIAIRQAAGNWLMVPLGTTWGGTQVRSFHSYVQRDGTEVVFAGS